MSTVEPVFVLERFTHVAPFGVRFWDMLLGIPVPDELIVTAYSSAISTQQKPAFPNRSGIYILQDVPGLREVENGVGDELFWQNLPPLQPFIIEVIDPRQQFLPFNFAANVPTRRLFNWICGSPPSSNVMGVPVYSAPTRSFPPQMAMVRADLFDPEVAVPAAWAVLEAYFEGQLLGRGIADDHGRIALVFDYPEPIDYLPDSPLSSGVPLTQQQWPIQLKAGYELLSRPILASPDLCQTLEQPPAILWKQWNSPADDPLTEVTLKFGQPLVLRSLDASNTPLAVLYITAL